MKIILEEQGLRDGIQNSSRLLPLEKKIEYVHRLVDAGIQRIQIGSFVHPKYVPQMADTDALCKQIVKKDGVIYDGLALNIQGVQRGIEAGLQHLSMSISASEIHSQRNVKKTLDQAKKDLKSMVKLALDHQITVRSGIQCAFGCRYEGKISPAHVLDLAQFILDLGVHELSLADTTGMANPKLLFELVSKIMELVDNQIVALHLHNTEGKGSANVYAGIQAGVRQFDTAFGGLGGCVFIPSATGNIATEDTAHMLHQMGYETGIDITKIVALSQEMEAFLGTPLQGHMYQLWHKSVQIV